MTTKVVENVLQVPAHSTIVPFVCYTGHTQDVYAIHPWNNFLVSGSRDKTIRVWNSPSSFTKQNPVSSSSDCIGLVYGHTENVRAVLAQKNFLITISWDKTVKVWKWTNEFLQKYNVGSFDKEFSTTNYKSTQLQERTAQPTSGGFLSKVFSGLFVSSKKKQSERPLSSSNETIRFASTPESSLTTEIPLECVKQWTAHTDWIVSTCFWNGWLCTGGFEGVVGVWEIEDEKNIGNQIKKLEKHSNYVGALGVVQNKLWSLGYDSCIKIWNTKFQLEKTIEPSGKHSLVSFYNEDDTVVYTGSGNGKLYVWSPEGEELAVLEAHQQSLNAINRWNNFLVTGCEAGTVVLWTKEDDTWKEYVNIKFPKFVKKIVIWKNRVWVASGNNIYGFKGRRMDWALERLLWLAYLKNSDNPQCELAKLPKDLVRLLIQICNELM